MENTTTTANPRALQPEALPPTPEPKTVSHSEETTTRGVVDIARIMQAIPHRYPFLMIDRVVDVVPNVSAVGVKNVTINEFFFQGHFPHHPVMPGVLIIEAMAQTAAVLVVETAKFRRPVIPGDQLRIHVQKERNRGNVWKFHAVARVDEVAVAEATYAAMIMDK